MTAFSSWQLRSRASRARGILAVGFLVLLGAFFKAQVLQSDQYRLVSEANRLRAMMVPASRGDIVDRHGELIAESVPGYTVRLLATRQDSLREVLGRLDALVPEDTIDIDKVVERWGSAPFMPVLVYGSGDFKIVARLQEQRALIPGLVIQAEPRRLYPAGAAVGHLAGYTREISKTELEGPNFAGAMMGEVVGKAGLEVEYDSVLRGQPGVRYAEVTGAGRMVRNETPGRTIPPTPGRTLQTTIDLNLQKFVDSLWTHTPFLSSRTGAVFAMRPDGEVLVLYSYPTFDPNAWIGGISSVDFAVYNDSIRRPMLNRVVDGTYPPASPFKLAVAAMGLKRGLVTMDTYMPEPCTGGFQFGARRFRCWKPEGHGYVNLTEAIKTSCDVYFYQLGLLIGADTLLSDAQKMGFGSQSGLDAVGEDMPRIEKRIKDYVDRQGRSVWNGGETLNLSIGQGRNSQTLANMVSFYSALASDGVKRAPFMVSRRTDAPIFDLDLNPAQLDGLGNAMSEVLSVGGTAGASGGALLNVAGKTGSGQVSGGKEDAGWFIGYAPSDNPQIVIGMLVEEGEHGSSVAPYVVKMISRFLGGADQDKASVLTNKPVAISSR